ncbi:hypothetical protein ACI77I_25820 [Pseudomonas sp. D47]|uniref:hypothetical protein n=1 Tax=Pseudomonas sp. D47 TaxID=3159447 RepID=UPI00387B96C4
MTETASKVEKWAYPLKVDGAQATDPQQYYAALAKAKNGYYPLGANGLWHGGVHFDESTGLVADLTEVQCIADGEVVAYRIDETYPKSDYGSTQAVYSTGFVLIKHRLEVPTPPARAPAAGAQPAVAAPAPSLTFFSLYMHLLDWEGYSANPSLARPPFWSGGSWQVKATADDKILGLRVRQDRRGKPGYTTVLSVLPRGTLVETGEEENGWLKVVSITPADPNVPAGSGWVFKREMTASATPNSYVIGTDAKDEMNPPRKGLAVHAAANQTSATTAILPAGTEVQIGNDGARGKYQKLLEIVSGNAVPELTASNGILGYIWEGLLETKSEPAAKNTVHLLERPFPVKAGSVIGHVGKYQNHDDAAPKNLLHLEVFSCEDVKAFTELSKSKARALPGSGKTLVKIPKDTPLITHVEGMSAENPPKVSDPFKKVGYEFVIPVGTLEALPAEKKIKVAVVMGGVTTYTYWWRIDGLLGDAEGNGIDGWFAEPDTALSRHSPFEWDGFNLITETVSNVEHLAASLHAQEHLTDDERATFLPQVSESVGGPVNECLYATLDMNGDKKISSYEIMGALRKPWFSQQISKVVTKYENEWCFRADKWDALDELMQHADAEPNKPWQQEKLRIKNLSWWDNLIGEQGVTSDAQVWHLHPIELVGSFAVKRGRQLITLAMLKKARPGIADAYCETILPILNKYAILYSIDTPLRVAHLLAQVGHESGFKVLEENLSYSAVRMRTIFGCRRNQAGYNTATDECIVLPRLRSKLWSEASKYANNAVSLGSYVYADRNGNGDEASQEGYKFRGRGIIQLTGKSNYAKYTRIHNEKDPLDQKDFVANPDLIVSDVNYGIESAFVWWDMSNMNAVITNSYATRTESNISQHVADISTKVNGGTIGLAERVTLFNDLRSMIERELN